MIRIGISVWNINDNYWVRDEAYYAFLLDYRKEVRINKIKKIFNI